MITHALLLIYLSKLNYIAIKIFVISDHHITIQPYYMCVYIRIYIKNSAWEDQRRKQCYIVHIAPQGVNSAIFFIYRIGYTYGKEPEGFQKVFLSPFSAG